MRYWFACEHPERPIDPWTFWHHGQKCCGRRALALLELYPDDPVTVRFVERNWPGVQS